MCKSRMRNNHLFIAQGNKINFFLSGALDVRPVSWYILDAWHIWGADSKYGIRFALSALVIGIWPIGHVSQIGRPYYNNSHVTNEENKDRRLGLNRCCAQDNSLLRRPNV